MPPVRARAEQELKEFEFHPEGDVTLVFTSKKNPKATENGSAPASASSRSSPYPAPSPATQIKMKVSSMHLMLASPVLKTLVTSNFKEGKALREHGFVEIELPEDDPEVFAIWLNVIHGHFPKVLVAMSVDQLSSLAILLDKYQAPLENLVMFTNKWTENFEKSVLQKKEMKIEDLLRSVVVAWKFGLPNSFTHLTKILIETGMPKPAEMSAISQQYPSILLLPDSIFDSIKNHRNMYCSVINQLPYPWVERYLGNQDSSCSCAGVRCNALALGYLMRTFYPGSRLSDITTASQNQLSPAEAYKKRKSQIYNLKFALFCDDPKKSGSGAEKLRVVLLRELEEKVAAQEGLNLAKVGQAVLWPAHKRGPRWNWRTDDFA